MYWIDALSMYFQNLIIRTELGTENVSSYTVNPQSNDLKSLSI